MKIKIIRESMAPNQKNVENTSTNPRNAEKEIKTIEILNEAWNLVLFPSILVRILKEMGSLSVSLSLILALAVSLFKMSISPLLRLRF